MTEDWAAVCRCGRQGRQRELAFETKALRAVRGFQVDDVPGVDGAITGVQQAQRSAVRWSRRSKLQRQGRLDRDCGPFETNMGVAEPGKVRPLARLNITKIDVIIGEKRIGS